MSLLNYDKELLKLRGKILNEDDRCIKEQLQKRDKGVC